jgi:hypothetical protein
MLSWSNEELIQYKNSLVNDNEFSTGWQNEMVKNICNQTLRVNLKEDIRYQSIMSQRKSLTSSLQRRHQTCLPVNRH